MNRICPHCKNAYELSINNFYRNRCFKGGFSYRCKTCCKATSLNSWSKVSAEAKFNKNARKKTDLRSRANSLMGGYRTTDRKKGIEFNITRQVTMSLLSQPCIYCGDLRLWNMGIDRIDNNLGHIIGNVVPCCYECNTARSNNFNFNEMLLIGSVIRKIKEQRIVQRLDPAQNT